MTGVTHLQSCRHPLQQGLIFRIANFMALGLYRIDARLGDRFGSLNYTAFGRKPSLASVAEPPA